MLLSEVVSDCRSFVFFNSLVQVSARVADIACICICRLCRLCHVCVLSDNDYLENTNANLLRTLIHLAWTLG